MPKYVDSTEVRGELDSQRFPHCIVWTPIPFITWFFPFVGHMGICTSSGVIRDFAGSYCVSSGSMAFGNPTKYLNMSLSMCDGGADTWDQSVSEASEEYKGRVHNLCCDNCHSHVALALSSMRYNNSTSWNMVSLAWLMFVHGKYVGCSGAIKTWFPFLLVASLVIIIIILT